MAFTFTISAFLGIFRDRLLYAKFYACCAGQLDAYNAAFRVPDIVFRLLVIGALSAAFIPVFSEQLEKNKKEAFEMASSVINILMVVFLFLSALIAIFAYPISKMIVPGFTPEQILLMSQLTRFMVLAQVFFLFSNFSTGILQTYQRFLLPALSPIVYNFGIIAGIHFLSPSYGVFGPAIGVVLGAALHFLVQIPLMISLGFKYSPIFSFKVTGVKKILTLMLPRTLSLGLDEVESTVALFLASNLTTGALSLYYLGQRLSQFFSRVFGLTIGQASLPVLSKEAGNGRLEMFTKILVNSLLQAAYLSFWAAAIFLVLRIPIVRLAYGASKFPWKATLVTGRVVAFFAPLVIFGSLNGILIRGFYALQDTKTPLLISFFSLLINVVASVVLVFRFNLGVYGLALASSISGLFQSILLIFKIIKKIKLDDAISVIFLPLTKMVIAGLMAMTAMWSLLKVFDVYIFDTSRIIGLILVTVVSFLGGTGIYFLTSLILKIKQANSFLNLAKKLTSLPKLNTPLVELPPQAE